MTLTSLEQVLTAALLSVVVGSLGAWLGGRNKVSEKMCTEWRDEAHQRCAKCQAHFCDELGRTRIELIALMRYARWDLQARGLTLKEINEILGEQRI